MDNKSVWKQRKFNLFHMFIFGFIVVVIVLAVGVIQDKGSKSTLSNLDGELSSVKKSLNELSDSEVVDKLPFMETPDITGHKVKLECGHVLEVTKEQVQDRLDRDLHVIRIALEMTEDEFNDQMSLKQYYEGQETTEMTLFMLDSLERFLFEVYADHLIEKYNIIPKTDEINTILNSYLKAFAELGDQEKTVEDLVMAEFGVDYQTWLDSELEKIVARSIMADHFPVDSKELDRKSLEIYNQLGNFARMGHILVDTYDEAKRIQDSISKGESLESFFEYSQDPDGFLYEFAKGEAASVFENWAFSAKVGDLDIIETEKGFHVVLLYGVTEGVSDVHKLRAQRSIADGIIYDGFFKLNWETINE